MAVKDKNYKLEILEYAINQSIDRLLPQNNEDALNVIVHKSNEVVWRVATDIYSKSGHQIDFLFIRDVLNLRIEPLRNKIAEKERIRKEKEAEEARIRARLEAQRLAKEAENKIIRKQQQEARQRKLQELCETYSNVSIEIFSKIESIIVDQLEIDAGRVTLDANLTLDLGADDLDITELMMALEEEFDIEIPDDFTGVYLSFAGSCVPPKLKPISVGKIVDLVFEKIQ